MPDEPPSPTTSPEPRGRPPSGGLLSAVRGERIGRYRVVDHLSRPDVAPLPDLPGVEVLAAAIDADSLARDVAFLAGPETRGRGRGTPGNAAGRAHIVRRLEEAGVEPAFVDPAAVDPAGAGVAAADRRGRSFERPEGSDGAGGPYAVNVAGLIPAEDAGADWVALVAHHDHLGDPRGVVHPGADDNASSVAVLLALADAAARAGWRPRRHVVLLFPDAEEPPNVRTDWMGSSFLWRRPPLPIARLHLALVLDLMGGAATDAQRAAGLGRALFVMGGEADAGLARLARGVRPRDGMEVLPIGLPAIETYPCVPGMRYSRSDYHGLRRHGRPFLFLTSGRTWRYHTPDDTAESLDYGRLEAATRHLARLLVHGTDGEGTLGFTDLCADPVADARGVLRLHDAVAGEPFPALLARALRKDYAMLEGLLRRTEGGAAPTLGDVRRVQLAATRVQAAQWDPRGWWFALW